jgi:hypothetical protein
VLSSHRLNFRVATPVVRILDLHPAAIVPAVLARVVFRDDALEFATCDRGARSATFDANSLDQKRYVSAAVATNSRAVGATALYSPRDQRRHPRKSHGDHNDRHSHSRDASQGTRERDPRELWRAANGGLRRTSRSDYAAAARRWLQRYLEENAAGLENFAEVVTGLAKRVP